MKLDIIQALSEIIGKLNDLAEQYWQWAIVLGVGIIGAIIYALVIK